jgi:hypothetical protein
LKLCDGHARQLYDSLVELYGPVIKEVIKEVEVIKYVEKAASQDLAQSETEQDFEEDKVAELSMQEQVEMISGVTEVTRGQQLETTQADPIICPVCNEPFESKKQLNGHMTKHRKEQQGVEQP